MYIFHNPTQDPFGVFPEMIWTNIQHLLLGENYFDGTVIELQYFYKSIVIFHDLSNVNKADMVTHLHVKQHKTI